MKRRYARAHLARAHRSRHIARTHSPKRDAHHLRARPASCQVADTAQPAVSSALIIGVSVGAAAIVVLACAILGYFLWTRKVKRTKKSSIEGLEDIGVSEPTQTHTHFSAHTHTHFSPDASLKISGSANTERAAAYIEYEEPIPERVTLPAFSETFN
jgi:hypothetical protein